MAAREYDDEPWVPDEWDGTPDVLPDWWLVAAGDGMKPSAEQMAALVAAHGRITRFRGDKMSQTAAVFVRSVVRDVLYAAPQPVTRHWVNYSLTVVSGLVRMCEDAGIALTRQRVFSERTRQRFLHVVCADHVDMAQAGYRSRLDVISGALSRSAAPRTRRSSPPRSTSSQTASRPWSSASRSCPPRVSSSCCVPSISIPIFSPKSL